VIIPNNFDLRTLQVFVMTADRGGMTQSARALKMTQSAVSQTISKLEDAIDVQLFDRTVRPIGLTTRTAKICYFNAIYDGEYVSCFSG